MKIVGKVKDNPELKRYLEVKVHQNKKNGQYIVMLPKRQMNSPAPKKVRLSW